MRHTRKISIPEVASVPMSRDTALSNGVSDDRSLKQELDLSKWVWKIAVLGYLETEYEA